MDKLQNPLKRLDLKGIFYSDIKMKTLIESLDKFWIPIFIIAV